MTSAVRRPGEREVDSPRRRPSRRRILARRWGVVAVLLAITGLIYLVFFTSVFGVSSVEVVGATSLSQSQVVDAAAIEPGTPLVKLDTDQVRARVAAVPKVAGVEVTRSWPGTVRIQITERSPVAVVKAADGVHLIDASGVDFGVVPQPPAGLPALAVGRAAPDDPATRGAVAVLGEIPQQLRAQVVTVSAATPGNIQLVLADGKTVKWGNAQNSAYKAAVLGPLLTRPGSVFDVASPELPTVS